MTHPPASVLWRLRPLPPEGDRFGWLVRGPAAVVWFEPDVDPIGSGIVTWCESTGSGGELLERLEALLTERFQAGRLPDLAAVISSGADRSLVVAGRCEVLVDGQPVVGDGWSTRRLEPMGTVAFGSVATPQGLALVRSYDAAGLADLTRGRVAAAGALLEAEGRLGEEPTREVSAGLLEAPRVPSPDGADAPAASAPADVVRASVPGGTDPSVAGPPADAPPRPGDPAPRSEWGRSLRLPGSGSAAPAPVVVAGVACGRGHLNDPRDEWCRVCGLAVSAAGPGSEVERQDQRPPMGVLVWDTGEEDTVAGDLVIGRDPSREPRVLAGTAVGLIPRGELANVSRVHAEIRLSGWDVYLRDCGSTNGTFLWDAADGVWRRLGPTDRVRLQPGTSLALAERVARFDPPGERSAVGPGEGVA